LQRAERASKKNNNTKFLKIKILQLQRKTKILVHKFSRVKYEIRVLQEKEE